MKVKQNIDIVDALVMKRRQLGIKQEDLAKKLGYSAIGLSFLETHRRKPTLKFLDRWTRALGIKMTIHFQNLRKGAK